MIDPVKKLAVASLVAIGVAVGISNVLQPSYALTNGGTITALGVPLTENFDTLASTGTGVAWADNSTIPGWYSTRATYNAGTGSSNAGALYSFGAAAATDRALGSVASGSTTTVFQAARLTNNTGASITALDISYVGEQWRNGGNTNAHTLTFQYQVANAGVVTGANSPATGWTTFAPLNFTGPVATATAAALDGNAAANRTALSATLAVTVNADQEIWLRWQDPDDAGADHGLAVDDFSVTANGVPADPAPAVASTSPSNGAADVPVGSAVVINFSESVDATAGAFSLQCPSGSPQAFTQSASPATTFTLTPAADLPYGTTCSAMVIANQVTDTDTNDPADQMAANFAFSFTTVAPPVDTAPAVTTTTPVNAATAVAAGSNIVIHFSENVTAGASAFAIDVAVPCSRLRRARRRLPRSR